MRRMILAGLMVCGTQQAASAQYYDNCQAPMNCQAPPYYCPPDCVAPPPVMKRPEAAVVPTQPEGAFVAGPQRGEVAGESRSFGLRMGALRIPEVTLPLPTFQMPCLVRYRRDAEMITESAHLPYVSGEVPEFALRPEREVAKPTPEAAVEQPPTEPESAPVQQPVYPCYPPQYYNPCVPGVDCTQTDPRQRIEILTQQLAQLNAAVAQLAALQQGQGAPSGRPAGYAAQLPGPSQAEIDQRINARFAQFEAEYQQKCAESEELRAQLAELQYAYQQMLDSRQRQVVAQREDRLRQQLGRADVSAAPAPAEPALPRGMPPVGRKIEPATYQEAAPVPATSSAPARPRPFDEGAAQEFQWRQPQAPVRATPAAATPADSRVSPSHAEPESKGRKGVLSKWFGRDR
jgi:hypothetical protein